MSQRFKTLYFPDRSAEGDGRGRGLTIAIGRREAALFDSVRSLSSLEVRELLGVPDWQALEADAAAIGVGPSTYCLSRLRLLAERSPSEHQLGLWDDGGAPRFDPILATYRGGNGELFHDWFPYLEGYSPAFVEAVLDRFAPDASRVLDPFGGAGTTPLVAGARGLESYYCEVNPVLQFVTEAKLRAAALDATRRSRLVSDLLTSIERLKDEVEAAVPDQALSIAYRDSFGDSEFFNPDVFLAVVRTRSWLDRIQIESPEVARFLSVSAIAALLPASRLIRRGDVRYRVGREIDAIVPFTDAMHAAALRIAADIRQLPQHATQGTLLAEDARSLAKIPSVGADIVVTSPPYLNGTNYFRNTKLELWFLRCLRSGAELRAYRDRAVTAGINDVSAGKGLARVNSSVTRVVSELEANAYDRRIPRMVQAYFEDMSQILAGLVGHVRDEGRIVIDIGDSNYAGVNVPTDAILTELMEQLGSVRIDDLVLRRRQARSGPPLRQVLLAFEKRQSGTRSVARASDPSWSNGWETFKRDLPHQIGDRAKRNWGHRLHSLCSYGGKMKPSLAEQLVTTFTVGGGRVLDPFAGVGTIPFEAAVAGRTAFAFEISPAAYHISRGKLEVPEQGGIDQVLVDLEAFIEVNEPSAEVMGSAAAIRFNGPLADYFHPATFREVMLARDFFALREPHTAEDSFVIAALLHVLHGNRPYALSRTSHPITPFAPSGPSIYRPLVEHVRAKVALSLRDGLPPTFVRGRVFAQDATAWWPEEVDQLDAVITSPPFFDSTRFHVQNWMRLWFCGWNQPDFQVKPRSFVDERQKAGFDVYDAVLRQAKERLRPGGVVVFHLGSSRKKDMARAMAERAERWFKVMDIFEEDVTHLESHGIRDKGTVTGHSYLVLE